LIRDDTADERLVDFAEGRVSVRQPRRAVKRKGAALHSE